MSGVAALVSAAALVGGAIVLPGTAGAAEVRADTPAPSPYSAGEFCSTADQGKTVVAKNGQFITCEQNNGLRWEPTGGVAFSNAVYSGDAAGSEVALTQNLIPAPFPIAAIGQAVASAATNSKGLTTAQASVPGNVINPALPASVLDYASGEGAGAGANPAALMPIGGGQAVSQAPPQGAPVTSSLASQDAGPLGFFGVLQSNASTLANGCPVTQPVAYGTSNAANVQLIRPSATAPPTIPGLPSIPAPPSIPNVPSSANLGPVINTAGTGSSGTATASTVTQTAFTGNGDGTYGIDSVAKETIAPITVDFFGAFQLQLTVAGASPSDPVTLEAHAPAEAGKPATVTLTSNDVITLSLLVPGQPAMTLINIPVSQLGPNGIHEDLSTSSPIGSNIQTAISVLASQLGTGPLSGLSGPLSSLGTALAPVTTALNGGGASPFQGSLGHIDIDATPFAIGGAPGSKTTATADGTSASGQVDLIHLTLGLSGSVGGNALPSSPLANIGTLDVGHLEASASLNKAFACPAAVTTAAAAPAAPAAVASTPAGTPQSLPVTGGEGGLWQPGLGVALLAVGGGLLLLIRRSRRRSA